MPRRAPTALATAAADLQHFHDTFFASLPNPSFEQIFPLGNPQYGNTCTNSKGKSGPCAAASWSGEATLDIEWAYSIAPEAHRSTLRRSAPAGIVPKARSRRHAEAHQSTCAAGPRRSVLRPGRLSTA